VRCFGRDAPDPAPRQFAEVPRASHEQCLGDLAIAVNGAALQIDIDAIFSADRLMRCADRGCGEAAPDLVARLNNDDAVNGACDHKPDQLTILAALTASVQVREDFYRKLFRLVLKFLNGKCGCMTRSNPYGRLGVRRWKIHSRGVECCFPFGERVARVEDDQAPDQ